MDRQTNKRIDGSDYTAPSAKAIIIAASRGFAATADLLISHYPLRRVLMALSKFA